VKFFLEQCLFSVQTACIGLKAEIFVVDNHSSDGSKDYLTPKFPKVHFKWNNQNLGFSKACNSVLKLAKGEHVLFLNPDTIVAEDALKTSVDFFSKNKSAGALGVRMLDGSGKYLKESKRGFPTPLASLYKMLGLEALFPKSALFAGYYAGYLSPKESHEVDVLAGAFMMLRKEVIEITKGFDEEFFMYGEDIDLSFRIKQAGFSNHYFADTSIIHFKGESTQKKTPLYIKHFYNAMWLFVKKHYANRKALRFFMNMAIALGRVLASVKIVFAFKSARKSRRLYFVNTAVIAGHQKFNECIQLIKFASPALLLAGRISIDKTDKNAAIGNVQDLAACVKKHDIGKVLLCQGEITNTSIIKLVDDNAGKLQFLFHAQGSTSIVGSNDKNATGVFISTP
jgi:GT2 family glycosyltransferase